MNFFDKLVAKLKAWFSGAKAKEEYKVLDEKADSAVDSVTDRYKAYVAEEKADIKVEKAEEKVEAAVTEPQVIKAEAQLASAEVEHKVAKTRKEAVKTKPLVKTPSKPAAKSVAAKSARKRTK